MKLRTVLLPGLLLGLAFPSGAQADIAPPPDYVESCTVEAQGPGKECTLCGDAYHGDRDACEKKHAGAGFERRCRTSGASVWEEVWCKTSPASPPTPVTPAEASGAKADPPATPQAPKPTNASGGGCSLVATGSGELAGTSWLFAVLGLGLARSRRRSRR